MARQSLIWTTLPGGLTPDGTGVRLSILVSPRLDPAGDPGTLATFPEWQDWPTTLGRATFTVRLGSAAVTIAAHQRTGPNRVHDALGTPDSGAWKALFTPDLPVRPFEFTDLANQEILSYDAAAIAGRIQELYATLATRATGDLPTASEILDDDRWRRLVEDVTELDERFLNEATGLRSVTAQIRAWTASTDDRQDGPRALGRFEAFHLPLQPAVVHDEPRRDDARISARWLGFSRSPLPTEKELVESVDFHQVVASMASYPTVMRRLGLVVDLVVERSELPDSDDALLSTEVTFPDGVLADRTEDASLATHARLLPIGFFAASRPAGDHIAISDGLLELGPPFSVIQVDPDGAGLKLLSFARSLRRLAPAAHRVDAVTRHDRRLGAPSLRTAGLMLVHHLRAGSLKARLTESSRWNAAVESVFAGADDARPPDLYAEDLLRGFRFDVWDSATAKWRSLQRRSADYVLGEKVTLSPSSGEEEGLVRLGATRSTESEATRDLLRLHEGVVVWTGWSLSTRPPGRGIMSDDTVDQASPSTEAAVPDGIPFRSRFRAVPRSLPRLRFGRQYRLRARAVDLAGNSVPATESDLGTSTTATGPSPFLRFEPIAGPVVALVRSDDRHTGWPGPGESMHRMAIRTYNDQPGDATPSTEIARRALVPARVSVRDAELHGALDLGGVLDPESFGLLASKDLAEVDPEAALIEDVGSAGDGPYVIYISGRGLTYLPDPLARTVAARIVGHATLADRTIDVPLYPTGDWPEALPFTVELVEPGEDPQWDSADRVLRIPLAKGDRAGLRLSIAPTTDALAKLAIWDWIPDRDRDPLRELALKGRHWMLTPWTTIDLVHAVQRPLFAPQITGEIHVDRDRSETAARPHFTASVSIKTTDKVELRATWHEPDDAPSAAKAGVDNRRHAIAFGVKITDPATYAARGRDHPHGGIPEHTLRGDDLIFVGPEHDLVESKQHEFGDTRYRRVEYRLEATTRFREFLPELILTEEVNGERTATARHITVTGSAALAWIPNSSPPPPPIVLYVVPTFGWTRSTDSEGQVTSWRRGHGLRVYLDRPWHISGYGEMLAVVLPASGFAGDPDTEPLGRPYKDIVTQWGNDPIWRSESVSGIAPPPSAFPLSRRGPDPNGVWLPAFAPREEADQRPIEFPVDGLSPPHGPTQADLAKVDIAPHDVFYDEDRRVWYSDIELTETTAYFPFIRLALARYQPCSVFGAHLSDVVIADFASLAPDRWVTVRPGRAARTYHVTVFGTTTGGSSGHQEVADVADQTVVEVWLEQLNEALGHDFGWHTVEADVRRSGETPPDIRSGLSAAMRHRASVLQQERRFDEVLSERLGGAIRPQLALWDGDVTVPDARGTWRIVIAEYEEYLTDTAAPSGNAAAAKGRRIVFVEHVAVG
jgi:hypothetical protein